MAFDSLPLRNCTTSSTERRGRIGVNGGRGERVYNSWTCSFVKERRKRERGSESRSRHHECCWHSRPHVTSPFHVQVPRRRAVPSTRLAPPNTPPFPGMYNVHVLNGGPTTKQEERERNILKLGFYTFTVSRNRFRGTCTQSNLMRVREGTNEKPRLGYVQTLVCCLILLKPWNRFDAGKNQLVDF